MPCGQLPHLFVMARLTHLKSVFPYFLNVPKRPLHLLPYLASLPFSPARGRRLALHCRHPQEEGTSSFSLTDCRKRIAGTSATGAVFDEEALVDKVVDVTSGGILGRLQDFRPFGRGHPALKPVKHAVEHGALPVI